MVAIWYATTKIISLKKEIINISSIGKYFTISTTKIENPKSEIPNQFALEQNYLNPFNPTTTIKYDVPKASRVTLKVFNILGQEVATLVDGNRNAGTYEVQFDGSKLTSGMYFYRIEAASSSDINKRFAQVKKMLLINIEVNINRVKKSLDEIKRFSYFRNSYYTL